MQTQTGDTMIGPAGKPKNCRSWAEYEEPRKSQQGIPNTANLCNGGWYKSEFYEPCASITECKTETMAAQGKRFLPTYGSQTHAPRPMGSQLLATTPNLSEMIRADRWSPMPATMPKSYVVQPGQQNQQQRPMQGVPTPFMVNQALPYPVQPPPEWPIAMQSAYVGPSPVMTGGITPTFLPAPGEHPFARLARNMANGVVGALGWQTFDLARSIDMFGRRK